MYSVQRLWSLREPWLVQTVWRCEIYSTQTLWDSGSAPLLGSLFRPTPQLNSVLILSFLKAPGFWWRSAFSGHFLWAPQPSRHFVAICSILIGHGQQRPQVVVHAPRCVRILRILAVRFLCFQLLRKALRKERSLSAGSMRPICPAQAPSWALHLSVALLTFRK